MVIPNINSILLINAFSYIDNIISNSLDKFINYFNKKESNFNDVFNFEKIMFHTDKLTSD